jgi:hypothetical protein
MFRVQRAAVKLHNRVSVLDPTNVDATLAQGLQDYILGSMGWQFKTLVTALGMRGDEQSGIRTVKSVADRGSLSKVDAEFVLCALYCRENQAAQAIPLLTDLIRRFPRNYLLQLQLAEAYSAAGDCARGLQTVQAVVNVKRSHTPGYYHPSNFVSADATGRIGVCPTEGLGGF